MKVYRGSDGDDSPLVLDCEEFGHPNTCSNGDMMYGNTHFKTEAEAWQSIHDSINAQLSLCGSAMRSVKCDLRRAQARAGEAAMRFDAVNCNYDTWKRNQRIEADD